MALDGRGNKTLSASEVEVYINDCARKWAFGYLWQMRGQPDPSAQLGTRCHSVLDDWLKHGLQPNGLEVMTLPNRQGGVTDYFPGQIVTAGLHLLPPPTVPQVEYKFKFASAEAVWTGRIDVRYMVDHLGEFYQYDPILALAGCNPVVLDHKTTSNFKWMKTQEVLYKDPQAALYAATTMEETGVAGVKCRWVYYVTRGQPEARPVEIVLTSEQVVERVKELDEVAFELHTLYRERPKPLDLPPNWESCEKYGGCPHRGTCNATVAERVTSIMAQESITEMLERKKREKDALVNGGVPPLVPPLPQPQPVVPPLPTPTQAPAAPSYWVPGAPMNAAQEYLSAKGTKLSILAMAADVPPPEHIARAYDAGGMTERGVINPPEAPAAAPSHPGEMPPVSPAPSAVVVQDEFTPMNRDQLKAIAQAVGLVDQSSRKGEDTLRKELRDWKAKGGSMPAAVTPPPINPLTGLPDAALAPPPNTQPQPVPPLPPPVQAPVSQTDGYMEGIRAAAAQARQNPAPVRLGLTVYVNCAPVGRVEGAEVLNLSELLVPVMEKMRADTGLSDYRMEDYGRGSGRLAAELSAFLGELQPSAGLSIVVDARSKEGQDSLGTLERMASLVVRGF